MTFTKYKSIKILNGADTNGGGDIQFQSGLWMNTNAVSSISFFLTAGTFSSGAIFALYGIKGA